MVTLTYFTTMSTYVAYALKWGKTVKMSFEGKNLQEIEQDIDYSEKKKKKKMSQGVHLPLLQRLFSIIFKHIYWYIQQISGERLQDH